MDIHGLVDGQSRPFHMVAAHHQSGLFHGIISGFKQLPDFLLDRVGFLRHADQFGGQRFTLAVEDLVSFPRKPQILLDADQVAAGGRNINVSASSALVVLLDLIQADAGQLFLRQHRKQPPANIQGLFDRAVFGDALVDEFMLEGSPKLQVLLIDRAQFFFADDRGQRAHILHMGIGRVELGRRHADGRRGCDPCRAMIHHADWLGPPMPSFIKRERLGSTAMGG